MPEQQMDAMDDVPDPDGNQKNKPYVVPVTLEINVFAHDKQTAGQIAEQIVENSGLGGYNPEFEEPVECIPQRGED